MATIGRTSPEAVAEELIAAAHASCYCMALSHALTEAGTPPDGEFFGEERLLSLLQEPASSASTLLDRVEASLQDHVADAEQFDDVTMLAVRRAPISEA